MTIFFFNVMAGLDPAISRPRLMQIVQSSWPGLTRPSLARA
jgi:hypothetical protein